MMVKRPSSAITLARLEARTLHSKYDTMSSREESK